MSNLADSTNDSEWIFSPQGDYGGRLLPEPGCPAGYAAIIQRYHLLVPLPPRMTALAVRHHPISTSDWLMLTPRHRPEPTLAGHLAFAFKWEGVDLGVLAALFATVEGAEIGRIVQDTPTGAFARRLWFLYEWLTEITLDIADPGKVRAVPVVDPDLQFCIEIGIPSARHKVIDNLPGTKRFCPMVRRSAILQVASSSQYAERARKVVGKTRNDLIARAASFLLVKDTKSSFAIEGERASGSRGTRWAQAIGQAGTRALSVQEFERLQRIVIGDARFVRLGLRKDGGFVGVDDSRSHEPVPDHINARHQDLHDLIEGVVEYDRRATPRGLDPVVAAAVISFGFVYIHPFEDGNGRIHRWLFHHVLGRADYNPPGVIFPISSAIERRMIEYRNVLESYSSQMLPLIDWRPTQAQNVEVLNETANYYRYFDATAHAEFLYDCVAQTIEKDLPEEVAFLEAHDQFSQQIQHLIDMPDRQIDLLRGFLSQNSGRLSKRARTGEFSALKGEEVNKIESIYAETFGKIVSD